MGRGAPSLGLALERRNEAPVLVTPWRAGTVGVDPDDHAGEGGVGPVDGSNSSPDPLRDGRPVGNRGDPFEFL